MLCTLEAVVEQSLLGLDHNIGLHDDLPDGLLLSALVILIWSSWDIEATSGLLERHSVLVAQRWIADSLVEHHRSLNRVKAA